MQRPPPPAYVAPAPCSVWNLVDLFVVLVSLVVILMDAFYVGPPLIWLTALRALR